MPEKKVNGKLRLSDDTFHNSEGSRQYNTALTVNVVKMNI